MASQNGGSRFNIPIGGSIIDFVFVFAAIIVFAVLAFKVGLPLLGKSGVEKTAQGPFLLDFASERPAVVYPPSDSGSGRPVMVMLHGMCALPEHECPVFERGATTGAWLLCPPGPVACPGGGRMWSGSVAQLSRSVERALDALQRREPDVDLSRQTLIGYSLGATAALRVASSSRGTRRSSSRTSMPTKKVSS